MTLAAALTPDDDDKPRRIAIVLPGGTLRCPAGHRFHDPLLWEFGGLRCTHKGRNGIEDCGKLVILLGGGLTTPTGDPMFVLAEVSEPEMTAMRKGRMNWHQMISFLGLEFLEET